MDVSNSMSGEAHVNKVYISDSPVADDSLEYGYVNSDVEDELGNPNLPIVNQQATFTNKNSPASSMPPQPDLSEVDELAKEAEYQRDLQDRLQNATIADELPSEYKETWEPESDGSSEDSNSEEGSVDSGSVRAPSHKAKSRNSKSSHSKSSLSKQSPSKSRNTTSSYSSSGSIDSDEATDEDGKADTDFGSDILSWKQPPANPFQISSSPANKTHDDVNYDSTHNDETKPTVNDVLSVPIEFAQGHAPNVNYQVQRSHVTSVKLDQHPVVSKSTLRASSQYQPQDSPQHQYTVEDPQSFQEKLRQYEEQQSEAQQAMIPYQPQQPRHEHESNYENPGDVNGYMQRVHADLEAAQYQQLQQEQLQQQQMFVRQQMLQQQIDQQQRQQMQQKQAPQELTMQRNAPVMYVQNSDNPNEYYAVTPRESYHPYEKGLNPGIPYNAEDGEEIPRGPKGIVAPKPVRPTKDYVSKNKVKASGQHSAKLGYSQRLVQKRVEQEQLKDWAPGMILPRKKAASADDIIRASERNDDESAEDVWSKRSRDLANAKQSKLAGGSKNKKRSTKNSPLKRFASDNNISKRNRVPPIGQPEPKGYLTSYQDFNNKWPAEDHHYAAPGIPGELSPTSNSPSGQYLRQRVPLANTYPQTNYQTNIPQHPLVLQQHPGMINSNSPSYLLQQSPYGVPEGAYSPQYNGGHEYNYQSGPPSGSYHHQTRQDPMRQPEYHQFTGHPDMANYSNKHQQPSYMPGQPSGPYAQHPSYDYSGYLNNSQGNQALLAMRDAQADNKPYEGSPYSSPHPSYSGNAYSTTDTLSQSPKKLPLNPYATVPPIPNPNKQPHIYKTPGSYVLAYQKEKEKIEKQQKGPSYKVYTMHDYKKLKLEYKLGGLGPSQDPEMLKEKNEARMKQLEYAKQAVSQEKSKPHPSPRKLHPEDIQQISGRQLMVEYAKHIPKPKVPPPRHYPETQRPLQRQVEGSRDKIAAMKPMEGPSESASPVHGSKHAVDLIELEDLQRRHEDEMRAVAEIQYKMQQAA